MKILITGVTGFLGSHLAKSFVEKGFSVIGLKRESSSTLSLKGIHGELHLYNREAGLENLFNQHSDIDVVVHTATCYGRRGVLSEVMEANVMLPLRLLELCTSNTSCVFINTDTYFSKASNDYDYLADYTFSKVVMRKLGQQFAVENNVKFINMQLEHVFGPNDGGAKFTSNVFQKLLANVNQLELTAGEQQRDFIYIDDVVDAFLTVVSTPSIMSSKGVCSFEVGTGKACSIKDFVGKVKDVLQSETDLGFGVLPYRKNELMHSVADTSALQRIGWVSKISLEDGIKKTIAVM